MFGCTRFANVDEDTINIEAEKYLEMLTAYCSYLNLIRIGTLNPYPY